MQHCNHSKHPEIRDYGCKPFIFNIRHATMMNENFRTTLWTGRDMQLTLMSIPVHGDIGVEMHPDVDQFICLESGRMNICMGDCRNTLREIACVEGNHALFIPAGTWHNLINVGNRPLKLYSLYAPPQHPFGTVHKIKPVEEHTSIERKEIC